MCKVYVGRWGGWGAEVCGGGGGGDSYCHTNMSMYDVPSGPPPDTRHAHAQLVFLRLYGQRQVGEVLDGVWVGESAQERVQGAKSEREGERDERGAACVGCRTRKKECTRGDGRCGATVCATIRLG